MKNNFEIKYRKILKECLKKGNFRNDRTGIGSYSIFDKNIVINISKYFPILTGRKIFLKIFETEFDWFINGETNIKRFQDLNIHIWDAWANKNGNLGPVYGFQMLNFNNNNINQLDKIIDSIKNNPDSRRHIITLWNPLQIDQMALPPCYHNFQFYVQNNKLNLAVTQRSGDLFLGIPYDICLFSKFLLYVSNKCGLKANIISLRIVDAHIYKNHIDSINEYLLQPILQLPKYEFVNNKINLFNYNYSKIITAPVAI